MARLLRILLCCGVLALAACRETGSEGEAFAVSGKLVVFNYRLATATFLVTLQPVEPMREGDVAVASFEDPAGGPSIEVRQRIWPKLDKVTIETPPLRCIREGRPYAASIRIEDGEGALRQMLELTFVSSQEQSVLPSRPLTVGPGYERAPPAQGGEPEAPPCPA